MTHRPIRNAALALLSAAALAIGLPTASRSADSLQRVTSAGMREILTAPVIEWPAGRKPDVTVVEYFDYNCPFCRRLVPTLRRLVSGDRGLVLIYKDWPVLGDVSVYAARCALAAGYQGKYLEAHDALLAGPRLASDAQVLSVLANAGVDVDRLKRDLAAHAREIATSLARNDAEARALELDGTPGLLVDRWLVPGVADLEFFEDLVAKARREKR